jgi:lycopene cyclase domain-containing protein
MAIVLLIAYFDKSKTINAFYFTFLVILIPFVLVNGILTGSFIDGEVVWYNNEENLGIRIFTIPIEDFSYGFSLILFNLLAISFLKNKIQQIN